jgi:hypothetical protein
MEELIEIIIRLIAGLFESKVVQDARRRSVTPPGYQGAPAAPGRIEPSNRVTMTPNMPSARQTPVKPPRLVRRRPAASVAMARPIIAGSVVDAQSPSTPGPVLSANVARAPVAQAAAKPAGMVPASAASLRKWLTPATLRQQFLLTEILQPPLALRSQDHISPDHISPNDPFSPA